MIVLGINIIKPTGLFQYSGFMMLFVFGVGHGVPVIPISTFSRAMGGRIGEKYIAAGKYVIEIFGLAVMGIGLIYAMRYLGYKKW